jgi:Omp85 superfamily domain
VVNYYGLGNNTVTTQPSDHYRVRQRQVEAIPALQWRIVRAPLTRRTEAEEDNVPTPAIVGEPFNDPVTINFAPVLKLANTPEGPNTDKFIAQDSAVYGTGWFGEVGVLAGVTVDTRDAEVYPRRGLLLRVAGSLYPEVWDVASTFGEIHGEASTYLSAAIPAEPTLALRVGAKKVWGTYPFFESAFIGGANTVRGYRQDRYAGDAAAYSNAELRLRLSRIKLLVPIGVGVFGGVDVGRVYYEGDPPDADQWHTAFGGGVWLAFIDRRGTATAGIMSGDDITGLYLRTGFAF